MSRRRERAHPCPTPSKRVFSSLEDARRAYLNDLANPVMIRAAMVLANRAYPCQCGRWHRTKRNTPNLGSLSLDE